MSLTDGFNNAKTDKTITVLFKTQLKSYQEDFIFRQSIGSVMKLSTPLSVK